MGYFAILSYKVSGTAYDDSESCCECAPPENKYGINFPYKIYGSEENLIRNIENGKNGLYQLYVNASTDKKEWTSFHRDLRNKDGWSNWNNTNFKVTYTFGNNWEIEDSSLTAPPTHLHLVLYSFSDERDSKSWKVSDIIDLDKPGVSALTDPDWVHYSDNLYLFRKLHEVTVNVGKVVSDDEKDYFGDNIKNNNLVYASFVVTGTGNEDTELVVSFGGGKFKETFKVIESDWKKIVLESARVNKNSGKTQTGRIVLVPS